MKTLKKVFYFIFIFLLFFSNTSVSSNAAQNFSSNSKTETEISCDENENSLSGKVLSRQKRNFGGSEPINYSLVFDGIFGVKGWLASGIEVFHDILFHVSGYTILGKVE